MDRRSKAVLSLSVVLTLALLVPVGALAKGKPTDRRPRTTCPFPAIIVGGGAFTDVKSFPTDDRRFLLATDGIPATAYPIDPDAYYYVQRVHKWQAQAYSTSATTVAVTTPTGATTSRATPS